jgi:hypothetical protein
VAVAKHLLILAKSIKHWPGVCIAGREVIHNGRQYKLGPWIRPIGSRPGAELYPEEILLEDGEELEVLDFVEVRLSRKMRDSSQPENWLIATDRPWRRVNDLFKKPRLPSIIDRPKDIWLDREDRSDRVADHLLKRRPPEQSLYLIHVPKLTAQFEADLRDGHYRKRHRATFTYGVAEYTLNITDPLFNERYKDRFPGDNRPPCSFVVKPPGGCYLCISLTPEFNGYHYKVVATILEA